MSERSWNQAMSGGARSSRQLEKGRASSGMYRLLEKCQVSVSDQLGEICVVDVCVDRLERDVGTQRVSQRVDERAVRVRVPEVAALGVGKREARRRYDDTHWPLRFVQALGNHAAELDPLFTREADERGHRVVEVRLARAVAVRQLVPRALVEEV